MAIEQLTLRSHGSRTSYSTSTYSSLSGSEGGEPMRRLIRHSSLDTINTNVTVADEFVWVDSYNRFDCTSISDFLSFFDSQMGKYSKNFHCSFTNSSTNRLPDRQSSLINYRQERSNLNCSHYQRSQTCGSLTVRFLIKIFNAIQNFSDVLKIRSI